MNGSSSRASSWLNWAQQPREAGGLGLAPHQAAGVVGNLVNESGQDLNPWGPSGDNGTAWGTAQWRGDRLAKLKSMYPDSYQTTEAQQAFMRHEMDTTENGAYRALLSAQSPEEAATAVNKYYERSADNTGGREKAARLLMAQFGGDTSSAPGALTSAFAPTESKNSMPSPALSADETLGPGVLAAPQDKMSVIGQALTGMGASLAGISNPDQARVLAAQAASMQKQAVDQGTWSTTVLPNGQLALHNSKRPMPIVLPGNFGKPEKDPYVEAAQTASAKSNQDYGDGIATAASNANGMAGDVATLKQVYSNPAVYQGTGGDWVQTARKLYAGVTGDTSGAKDIADGDIARALSNKLALKLVQDTGNGKLLPGSFSDSDRKFVQQMTTSLENNPEANQRLLGIYERSIQRAQQADEARQAHLDSNDGIYRPTIRGEIGKLQSKWSAEDQARGEAEAKAPTTTAKPANTFKTKSGVTWSVH